MIFGLKHLEITKLGSERITVKISEVGQPPLLAESSTAHALFTVITATVLSPTFAASFI